MIVYLHSDAQNVLIINDETVSERVSEQMTELLRDDKNVDLELSLIHI